MYDDIGQRIAQYRRDRGYTQAQLADAAGINRSCLARLERGSTLPLLETVVAIAYVMGVTIGKLIGEPS